MNDALRKLLEEISIENIYEHIKNIVNIGEKLAGSKEELKFVEYVTKVLGSYNIECNVYEFEGYVSRPIFGKLEVIYPEKREIPCVAYAQSASTPAEGVEGEIVYVGAGGLEDYVGKDVKGKITLAELSYSPPRPEKVRIAQEYGAIGQIQISWGLEERKLLSYGTVKNIWGNPTPDDVGRIVRIPAVGITKADGMYLKKLLEQHSSVKARLQTTVWRGYLPIHNIVASIHGSKEKRFIVVNGHFDCWGPGATDNATGNAAMLELARVFNELRHELRRGIKFAWWSGHETGIMAGSTWYVDNFWDELNRYCVGWLNIDSIGMKGTDKFFVMSTEEIRDSLVETIKEVDKTEPQDVHRIIKVGDQSTLGLGIPSMSLMTAFPREVIIKEVGRYTPLYLGWWYHSSEDTMDKVDIETLKRAVNVYAVYIYKLLNSPVLPYKHSRSTNLIVDTLEKLNRDAKDIIDLGRCVFLARELHEKILRLEEIESNIQGDEELEELNEILIKLSRYLIPLLYTYDAGKYGQDPYGLSYLNYPIPLLHPIEDLVKMPKDSEKFIMLKTKLLRNRNKICDILELTLEIIKSYLERFRC
jgi:hypothetical protein